MFTDPNKTFSVTPACIDVPPLKSFTFNVSFKPVSRNIKLQEVGATEILRVKILKFE